MSAAAATTTKLGISFYAYLKDRIIQGGAIAPIGDLIAARAATLSLGASWASGQGHQPPIVRVRPPRPSRCAGALHRSERERAVGMPPSRRSASRLSSAFTAPRGGELPGWRRSGKRLQAPQLWAGIVPGKPREAIIVRTGARMQRRREQMTTPGTAVKDPGSAPAATATGEANNGEPNLHAGRRGAGRLILVALKAVVVVGAAALVLHLAGAEDLLSPERWLGAATPWAALASVLLLALDAVLPVPASLLMVANGALFGPLGGAVLSTAGSLASSLLAFALGRWARRAVWIGDPQSLSRADDLLNQWGAMAVVLSRPVPLLAESLAMVAGAGGFSSGRFFVASLAGAIPASIVYAWIGAAASGGRPLLLLAGAYLALALTTVLLQRYWKSNIAAGRSDTSGAGQTNNSWTGRKPT